MATNPDATAAQGPRGTPDIGGHAQKEAAESKAKGQKTTKAETQGQEADHKA